jgi:hypothetical protein
LPRDGFAIKNREEKTTSYNVVDAMERWYEEKGK